MRIALRNSAEDFRSAISIVIALWRLKRATANQLYRAFNTRQRIKPRSGASSSTLNSLARQRRKVVPEFTPTYACLNAKLDVLASDPTRKGSRSRTAKLREVSGNSGQNSGNALSETAAPRQCTACSRSPPASRIESLQAELHCSGKVKGLHGDLQATYACRLMTAI